MLETTVSPHHEPETRLPFEPEMMLIPAGEFLMGSDPETDADADEGERPQHKVYLPGFYLARTPVTHAQYGAFLQDTEHRLPKRWRSRKIPRGKEELPIVYVSWHDAVAYCRWLSETTGKHYRLPSEAEWEKGASWEAGEPEIGAVGEGGALSGRKRRYPWGDEWDADRCNTEEGEEKGITPVDAYPQGASPYGVLDMAGNTWEWTISLWGPDWYTPAFAYPYDPSGSRENLTADDSVCRVLRGGSFAYAGRFARSAYRYKNFPQSFSDGIGFRVVWFRFEGLASEKHQNQHTVSEA